MEELDLKAKTEVRRSERASLLTDLMSLLQSEQMTEEVFFQQINFFATEEEATRIRFWWKRKKVVRSYIIRFKDKEITRGYFLSSIKPYITQTEYLQFIDWTDQFLSILQKAS